MDQYPSTPSPKVLIGIGVGILVFLIIIVVAVTSALRNRVAESAANGPTPLPQEETTTGNPFNGQSAPNGTEGNSAPNVQGGPLVKVGGETLYQEDLAYQKSLYAGDASEIDDQDFIDQLVKDSIILQGGDAAGFIDLDKTMYNSTGKNYILRQRKIQDVMTKVNAESQTISGYVVSIWFANEVPPKMGLEQAKVIAQQKITALHTQVKEGKMTIQQAGQAIKNDKSLADLDIVHDVNAIFPFTRKGGEKITISSELDAALWRQPVRGVTDVFLVKSTPTFGDKPIDALYMFGQVTAKNSNKSITNFDSWLAEQQKKYEVTEF